MTVALTRRDYSLTGPEGERSVERGLAAAEWYHPDIPRKRLKELMRRRDGPALRDLAIWVTLIVGSGALGGYFWGTWLAVPFFIVYGVLYGSSSDSRWHECGHGTAFKTSWLNEVVYQVACFMIMRNPEVWRWSHARHHTDTIIVGRDPEIIAMRPPKNWEIALNFLALPNVWNAIKQTALHARGKLTADQETFIPKSEWSKVFLVARIWVAIYAAVIALALFLQSWLPLMYVGLPTIYGGWLVMYTGLTQHTGLAEDVLDHRLNTRTIYMNPILRFMYLNMNYHIEHHMYPMVPYYNLPELHKEIKKDLPEPYKNTFQAYREIITALFRQRKNPGFYYKRELPPGAKPFRPELHEVTPAAAQ
ncbi:MAG: fatty acid desaturase family protein [Azospirillaceae bacterium]